jgi:hypothetical protein
MSSPDGNNRNIAEDTPTDIPTDASPDVAIGEAEPEKKSLGFCCGLNKRTLLLAGTVAVVVVVLYVLYIHAYLFGHAMADFQATEEDFIAGQFQMGQDNDVYYQELRQAIIANVYGGKYDPYIFLLPNSPQRLAMEWLAYRDVPHVPLHVMDNEALSYRCIQRFVLMVIFFANNGHSWSIFNDITLAGASHGWASHFGKNECQWELVGCDQEGRLTSLSLGGSAVGMSGTLMNEIGLLTSLRHLDLSQNQLKGELPEDLHALSHLGKLSSLNPLRELGADWYLTSWYYLYLCLQRHWICRSMHSPLPSIMALDAFRT